MLAKLNKLQSWQAALILAVVGFAVYFDGLKNQFLGDDSLQIVNNPPVHSISHIALLFEGGTFYTGHGLAPLSGVYFRPLMMVFYSILYTVFGPHPLYFHLFQLLVVISSSIILYLFFRFSFKPVLALFLSLVFLVHPINSEIVFAISTLQDALFFFFGILALYLLARFKSTASMLVVAACLLLSLLAKETAVLFIVIAALYLFWYNRKRLYAFLGIMIVPVGLWLVLKIHAIGLLGSNPNNAPIDRVGLAERLFTAPSSVLFYIVKFIFPWKLASGYYWVIPKFSVTDFLLPLIADLGIIALVIYGAVAIKKVSSRAHFYSYLFFAVWAGIGLLPTLQIIPLDMTASESWFYFPMVGFLGMIGITVISYSKVIDEYIEIGDEVLIGFMVAILLIFGVRTIVRGPDWTNVSNLAFNDIKVSKEDYNAYGIVAINLYNEGKFKSALADDNRSVAIFPNGTAYQNMCIVYFKLNEGVKALQACENAMKFPGSRTASLDSNTALIMMLYGNPQKAEAFAAQGTKKYPNTANLWLYLAIEEYERGDKSDARRAITKAARLGQSTPIKSAYSGIMHNQKLIL